MNLIDLNDWSVEKVQGIVDLAQEIMKNPQNYLDACKGKIMATLFYEPSTRTQMSFQTAMLRLGGQVIGFDNPSNSSVSKGETLKDTIKIVSGYSDVVVIRHPVEGAAMAAAINSNCPVVNAGDGGHLHPTQTLTDLVTLTKEKGRLNNLKIGLCGDLKNGRTVHSLIKAMLRYENNVFYLISTKELAVPTYIKDILDASNCTYYEVNTLEEVISELDVLYMTRIQKERFASEEEYLSQKNIYILDKEKMNKAKSDLKVLHPLPRVDEITMDVDSDPRAVYFKQAVYGMFARMALILTITTQEKNDTENYKEIHVGCTNKNCISNHEKYLPKIHKECGDMLVCKYCDQRILI